ncbi:MAG TPA: enoyl-CoA hydratase-related protein [Acidobacteriaceae bacterium]|jgi:enoyl-CoA hydratase|nr:enoyl-CoA hydratase-related protein [Acidobacteriaceae bacterium]
MQAAERDWTRLRVEREGAVATVTLDRPEVLHALDAAMFDELERAFAELAADAGVRAILLTGAGERAFAAGADIRGLVETDAESGRRVSERGQSVFSQIERCAKPVIACVNGVALGGGCELALACTFRMASERARMGLPELKLGLIPGYGGTQRLPRLIGRSAALRMLLTGATVDAAEALRLGLVDEVTPGAELMSRARAAAEMIAGMAPLAVAGLLEAVRRGEGARMEEALGVEAEIFGRLCGTADKREGLAAFLEKRTAEWAGR